MRQLFVPIGPLDEPDIARFREFGTGILYHAQRHVAVAALDKHVGYGFGEGVSSGDREQVLLALGSGVLYQGNVVKQARLHENRAGYIDCIIERAMVQDREETILIVVKAIGFSWATAKAVLLLCADKRGISTHTLDQCLTVFNKLKPETAKLVLEFQRKRQVAPADSR